MSIHLFGPEKPLLNFKKFRSRDLWLAANKFGHSSPRFLGKPQNTAPTREQSLSNGFEEIQNAGV